MRSLSGSLPACATASFRMKQIEADDEAYEALCRAREPVEQKLIKLIQEQRAAEEQRASQAVLKSVPKALREARLALPADEYGGFDIHARSRAVSIQPEDSGPDGMTMGLSEGEFIENDGSGRQRELEQKQLKPLSP